MNIRILAAAGVMAATIGLTACSPTTTTSSSTATQPSQETKVDALVKVLQARYPGATRTKIIDIAKQACTVVDEAGGVALAIAQVVADDSIDVDTAGDISYVIGVAIPVYCPEYMPELEQIASN